MVGNKISLGNRIVEIRTLDNVHQLWESWNMFVVGFVLITSILPSSDEYIGFVSTNRFGFPTLFRFSNRQNGLSLVLI